MSGAAPNVVPIIEVPKATNRPPETPEEPHPIMALSFVREVDPDSNEGQARHFWSVPRTGNMRLDDVIGCHLAAEAIRYMKEEDAPYLLGWIIRDMQREGEFGFVEIGFCHAIALAARR